MKNFNLKTLIFCFMGFFVLFFFLSASSQFSVNDEDSRSKVIPKPEKSDQSDTERVLGYRKAHPSPGPQQNGPSDSTGKVMIRSTTTIGAKGDPTAHIMSLAGLVTGRDIHVRDIDFGSKELNQTMASDSNGNLYVAWQDDYFSGMGWPNYIQVYKSQDGGTTWDYFGYVTPGVSGVELREPSIAVGEGYSDLLLLAYVVDDGTNIPIIEVATAPLDGSSAFTTHSVPYWSTWDGYSKPVIWTNSINYPAWSAYLTAEGIFDSASNDIDIVFWKSQSYGASWGTTGKVLRGNTDSYAWTDPDGAYGCSGEYVYVVCYRGDDKTLYLDRSSDSGSTFSTNVAIYTLTDVPNHNVDPEIEAATTGSNVMVCCTKSYGGNDNIGWSYSTDSGDTWSYLYSLPGSTSADEFAPCLTANEGGGSFHLAYTRSDWYVYYSHCPQDLSRYWQSSPIVINDSDWASASHPKKGIASNWDFDFAGIVWADYRDSAPDYDTYFDRFYPDDLLGTWAGQGVYFRTETGKWKKMASPADLIAAGDIDEDGTSDLLGVWTSQGGVWVRYSSTGAWAKLGSTARDISSGDMNGDGSDDLLGTWDGQGVYYLDSVGGTWVMMANPADCVAAGDLDGDGTDDLIGIWLSQGGVWVRYSSTGTWDKLGSTARDISSGDMNGDGRDDLLGTWDGQGVYYLDSVGGTWVKMATPADFIAAGDLDGDGTDDLLGVWSGQGGVWVKYSSTGTWHKLSSSAKDIAAGIMRGGSGTWFAQVLGSEDLIEPAGGQAEAPGYSDFQDFSKKGPGGLNFVFQVQKNLVPKETGIKEMATVGPGEIGFQYIEQKNLVPKEREEEKNSTHKKFNKEKIIR